MNRPTRPKLHEYLKKAVENDDVEQVQTILHEEPHLVNRLVHEDDKHYSFLFVAAEKGFLDNCNVLLEAKANVNQQCYEGMTPLFIAARMGHAEIVKLLLAEPAIVVDLADDCRATPLAQAAHSGYTSIVQQLLDANASVDSVDDCGDTALLDSARRGHLASFRLLLHRTADVNHQNHKGHSSLHCAVTYGDERLVTALLDAKATVDSAEHNGLTPLMLASYFGELSLVKLCLAAGADVSKRDANMFTALHKASDHGTVAVVDELLQAGADPNAIDHDGCSPLIRACHIGNTEHSLLLLQARADINATDNRGNTSLIKAIGRNRAETTKVLLEHGADWLIKGEHSAKHLARYKAVALRSLFDCTLCGWTGMCCSACRQKYCVFECSKFSGAFCGQNKAVAHATDIDPENATLSSTVDCRLHRQLAHQSLLDWTLAMASLQLPPYVVEHIFNCSAFQYSERVGKYQKRIGATRMSIVKIAHPPLNINENFIHLIVKERTHQENVKMFISVHQAYRRTMKKISLAKSQEDLRVEK